MFWCNWVQIDSGMFRNMFKTFVLLSVHPVGAFLTQNCISKQTFCFIWLASIYIWFSSVTGSVYQKPWFYLHRRVIQYFEQEKVPDLSNYPTLFQGSQNRRCYTPPCWSQRRYIVLCLHPHIQFLGSTYQDHMLAHTLDSTRRVKRKLRVPPNSGTSLTN